MSQQTPAAKLPRLAMPAGPERSCLVAGVGFIDGVAAGWGCWELTGWLEDHLVARGRTPQSFSFVHEPGCAVVGIDPRWSEGKHDASLQDLPRVLAAARKRVIDSLRAFLPPRGDDRFLHAAIYCKRVERRSGSSGQAWEPTLAESDRLSDIVLALFAADILMHREFHDSSLCVCEVCGRVSFDPTATSRSGCPLHNVRGQSGGFPRFEV